MSGISREAQRDIDSLNILVDRMGLNDYAYIGTTALLASGLINRSGMLEMFTQPGTINGLMATLLTQTQILGYDCSPLSSGGFNESLVVEPRSLDRKSTIVSPDGDSRALRIMEVSDMTEAGGGRWTLGSLKPNIIKKYGLYIVDPVVSLQWLFQQQRDADKSAVFRALVGLDQRHNTNAPQLFAQANEVWPRPHSEDTAH